MEYRLLTQLLACFIGIIGICLVFKVDKKHILVSSIGAVLCWLIYSKCIEAGINIETSSFISAAFCEVYAEICARYMKAPAIIFLLPCIFPLIPGSSLYYTFFNLANKDYAMASLKSIETVKFVFSIAMGMSIAWYLFNIIDYFSKNYVFKKVK